MSYSVIYKVSAKKDKYLFQLGEKIRDLRLQKNLSQFELAVKLNRDQQSIQRVEKGRVNPSIYFLVEIAEALKVEVEEILP